MIGDVSAAQARAVRCPTCGAPSETHCRYTGGGPVCGEPMAFYHASRYEAAAS